MIRDELEHDHLAHPKRESMSDLAEHFEIINDELEILIRQAHAHPQFISLERVRQDLAELRRDCERHGFVKQDS